MKYHFIQFVRSILLKVMVLNILTRNSITVIKGILTVQLMVIIMVLST